MLRPPLIQDLAIVGKVLLNAFHFWGPKNSGPNPDYPFSNNLQDLPGPSVPWGPYLGRLFSIFAGVPCCKGGGGAGARLKSGGGGGAPRLKRVQHYSSADMSCSGHFYEK